MNVIEAINEQEVLGKRFRVYSSIDEPLFIAKDVAEWIDYDITSVNKMIVNVDADEKVRKNIPTHGGMQETWCLTEDGLYEVLMQSRKPIAKEFKKEVKKILKIIRKTGGYVNNSDLMINTYFDDLPEDQKVITKQLLTSIESKQKKIEVLNKENALLAQQNLEWTDRPMINAIVRAYATSLDGGFREAWVDFKKELLYQHGINLNARITNYMNSTGKKTKPKTLDMLDDSELSKALSVAVAMCKQNGVDISDIINKKAGWNEKVERGYSDSWRQQNCCDRLFPAISLQRRTGKGKMI